MTRLLRVLVGLMILGIAWDALSIAAGLQITTSAMTYREMSRPEMIVLFANNVIVRWMPFGVALSFLWPPLVGASWHVRATRLRLEPPDDPRARLYLFTSMIIGGIAIWTLVTLCIEVLRAIPVASMATVGIALGVASGAALNNALWLQHGRLVSRQTRVPLWLVVLTASLPSILSLGVFLWIPWVSRARAAVGREAQMGPITTTS